MVLQGAKKNFILKRFPKINVPGLKEIIRPTSVCETRYEEWLWTPFIPPKINTIKGSY